MTHDVPLSSELLHVCPLEKHVRIRWAIRTIPHGSGTRQSRDDAANGACCKTCGRPSHRIARKRKRRKTWFGRNVPKVSREQRQKRSLSCPGSSRTQQSLFLSSSALFSRSSMYSLQSSCTRLLRWSDRFRRKALSSSLLGRAAEQHGNKSSAKQGGVGGLGNVWAHNVYGAILIRVKCDLHFQTGVVVLCCVPYITHAELKQQNAGPRRG